MDFLKLPFYNFLSWTYAALKMQHYGDKNWKKSIIDLYDDL